MLKKITASLPKRKIPKHLALLVTFVMLLGVTQTIFLTPVTASDIDVVSAIRLEPNVRVTGRLGSDSPDGKIKGDDWYVIDIPDGSETSIYFYISSDLGEGLAAIRGYGISIYDSYDKTNAIQEIREQQLRNDQGNNYGPFYLSGGTYYLRIGTNDVGSGDYSMIVNTTGTAQTTIPSQTFPPYAIKTLEVVGGLPSTITTETNLKFVATTDASVTKVLFADNYFFDNRNNLETVTSSNGVFQTTKSYTFSEGSHIIYCFPIDADENVVWDNGLGVDEAGRSYGAPLNVVKPTGSQGGQGGPQGGFQGGFQGESISVGAKFRWSTTSGVLGYRVYRSESDSDEGISITDFYITSNEFVDVNVKPNKTYYYTVRGVIAEARPFDSIPEQLTSPSDRITVMTPSTILGDDLQPPSPSATKKFILMTLDDPYMTINGTKTEIDPGRGTTPLLLNSRTMVPIRAIVEGMGGTIDWNGAAREITLNYTPNTVKMTLDKEQFTVNGATKTADVPPTSINDRTMLPIRFAAESLGCAIDWLNSTRQVVIVYY